MATTKGKDGRFKVGANTVAETRSFRFTRSSANADDSNIEDEWDTAKGVTKSWSGSAEVWWDASDTNGQAALDEGDEPTVYLYPTGTTAGQTYFHGAVIVESVEITNTRDGIVEASIQFKGNGICNKAVVGT